MTWPAEAPERTNHPVVMRADPAGGTTWYETRRGVLPVSPEAAEDGLARERRTLVELPEGVPATRPDAAVLAAGPLA